MKYKIVTVCSAGISRSVGLAYHLKMKGHEVLPVGAEYNAPETLAMLADWADKIICMEPRFVTYVPKKHIEKVLVCNVGEDVYFNGIHPDLTKLCSEFITKHSL